MKIAYSKIEVPLDFGEDNFLELSIDCPKTYRLFLEDLVEQQNQLQECFVISQKDEILKIDKELEIIMDFIRLDFSDRKMGTQLLKSLVKESVDEEMYELTTEVKSEIFLYLDRLFVHSMFDFQFDDSLEISSLLKACGVEVKVDYDNSLEKITEYIRLKRQIMNIKLFVFVNLSDFLTKEEIEELKKYSEERDIFILFLEYTSDDINSVIPILKIDSDLCVV